jgi:hypothetical protein
MKGVLYLFLQRQRGAIWSIEIAVDAAIAVLFLL